ncbi:Transmembrane protein 147 [Glycine max]|nr:Transmembrane protein 147 [Glycine max]
MEGLTEFLKALIGFIDVVGLYFALTQLTHRNISQNHKFQAVGLVCWAFADFVLHRLAPLWVGARGLEFTWDYILQGLEANANLLLSISLVALGSLMWLQKNKPKTLIPIIYLSAGIVATMPSITSQTNVFVDDVNAKALLAVRLGSSNELVGSNSTKRLAASIWKRFTKGSCVHVTRVQQEARGLECASDRGYTRIK